MFSIAEPPTLVRLLRRRGGPSRFAALWPDLRETLQHVRLAERRAMHEDGSAPDPGASSASYPHAA